MSGETTAALAPASFDERVLIFAPLGNDARLTSGFLAEAGLGAEPCADAECFAEAARDGCGAWLLAEEALDVTTAALLGSFLAAQPSWSDLPIIIIAGTGGETSSARRARLAAFGPGSNVSILERPFRPATLVSTIRAALRARRRQYEVRDLLAQSARDALSLRESRHFLQCTIDALSSHIAVLDAEGIILEVNTAWKHFADINGYTGANYGVGTNYLKVLEENRSGECEDAAAARGIHAVIEGEEPRFQIEYPCHSPDERRWYLMTVTRFPGDGAVRVVVAHENITSRVLANLALREADRRKDEFLAMLAHELRNPLASVANAATLLAEGAGESDRVWAAEVITRQSSQLARLVDDLLDVSRITRGKIELRKELLDAARCLESACEAVAPEIAARNHTLLADFPRGELWLEADQTRLEQIVVNLLANAAKYSRNHSHIRLAAQQADGEIIIRVTDDGIGIPPERIPEMFELFAQGERSAARSEGGLGIGLTVVRGLCELHGGSITAHSDGLGHGSTFTVRLPAAPVLHKSSRDIHSAPAIPPPRTGTRILVVDDNVDTAAGLSRLLARRGYVVELAHDGPTALEKARIFAPAVVLLDIGLPGMDGYQVAGCLRADPATAGAVILALSGYGQAEDRTRSRAAGFDHHLVKPIDFGVLETLLGEFLRNCSMSAARHLRESEYPIPA